MPPSLPVYPPLLPSGVRRADTTKILVGLGLMELRHIPEGIQKIAAYFATGAGNSSQVQIFAAAITVYFSVVGFLSGYLLTRIYVAGAFSRADQEYPAVHENSRRQEFKVIAEGCKPLLV